MNQIDRIKEKLLAQGMQPDEIATLFKTDEELIAYYHAQEAAKSVEVPDDEETEPEPEDDFRLNPAEEHQVLEAQKQMHVEESRKRFDTAAQAEREAEEQMPEAEREPVESEKVNFDDFLKSIEEGLSADDSNIPNN